MSNELKITLIKSPIGAKEPHKRTLRALDLTRLHKTVTKPDNPSIRGMLTAVEHLVTVEEAT